MRDRVLGRVLMVATVAGLVSAVSPAAAAESKPERSPGASAGSPADPNTDNFCRFDEKDGNPAFQCDLKKGRYPIGTPCICPGKAQIGKITHR